MQASAHDDHGPAQDLERLMRQTADRRRALRWLVAGGGAGVPLTVKLRLVNTNGSCAYLSGYALYLSHCTAGGLYSMYSTGVTGENCLRGVQATDCDGLATFVTIYPGCYSGRVPHIHFEVYRSTNTATQYGNKLKTSQLTFNTSTSQAVDANGASTQTATAAADTVNGYVATPVVGIAL